MGREELFFEKLFPYLDIGKIAVVGWVATRHHLMSSGVTPPEHTFNDIDLVADSLDAVSRNISREFLVYHYHPNSEYPFLALVDPETRIKVDIFPRDKSENTFDEITLGGRKVRIARLGDQLVKTVLDCKRILEGGIIDPKWLTSLRLLGDIADWDAASDIWSLRGDTLETLTSVIGRIEQTAAEHPELLKEKMYRRNTPYVCEQCRNRDGFVVVPMEKVYEVLGYVE